MKWPTIDNIFFTAKPSSTAYNTHSVFLFRYFLPGQRKKKAKNTDRNGGQIHIIFICNLISYCNVKYERVTVIFEIRGRRWFYAFASCKYSSIISIDTAAALRPNQTDGLARARYSHYKKPVAFCFGFFFSFCICHDRETTQRKIQFQLLFLINQSFDEGIEWNWLSEKVLWRQRIS